MLTTLENWYLWGVIYSVLGWLYETVLCSAARRAPANRGFLHGPYCPIYGTGAVLVILILGGVSDPLRLFLLGAGLTCAVEYLTSWGMETLFHARWWDYSKRFCNLNGRVCLLGAAVFGLFSVLLIKGIHPFVSGVLDGVPPTVRHLAAAGLLTVQLTDLAITLKKDGGLHNALREYHAALPR